MRAVRRRGVGLPDMLMALMISSMLLVAAGAAMNASIKAHQITGRRADLNQAARTTLHRVLSGIRTSAEHAPIEAGDVDDFAGGATATVGHFGMYDAAGRAIVFRHDPAAGVLHMSRDGQEHVLLRGVTTFEVTMEPMRSRVSRRTGGGFDLLRRAGVLLTLDRDGERVTLSGSVVPRRNFW